MLTSDSKTVFDILGRRPIHPFPARMAPGIALEALRDSKTPLRVLDPMSGSGTVLAVARSKGHKAFGVDVDPLAVLLAGVWTRSVDAEQVKECADDVLDRARSSFKKLRSGAAYPARADDDTRKFIRYWFDPYARKQLAALSFAIERVDDDLVRDTLWCGFSRLIITKSAGASLAMDLSHSRPHRSFEQAPVKPFRRFLLAVEVVVSNCPQKGEDAIGPPTVVRLGDARKLALEDASIDLVLTSPPYLNAIDYMRCSKFSLVWMGHTVAEIREIRGGSIGSELGLREALNTPWVKGLLRQLKLLPALSDRDEAVLARYVWDMHLALGEVTRVLRKSGRAIYVVGDSTTRGTFISNSDIVAAVAQEHGLVMKSRSSRELPANRRYLPPPRDRVATGALDGRMRREVVLAFGRS